MSPSGVKAAPCKGPKVDEQGWSLRPGSSRKGIWGVDEKGRRGGDGLQEGWKGSTARSCGSCVGHGLPPPMALPHAPRSSDGLTDISLGSSPANHLCNLNPASIASLATSHPFMAI